jgi:hypothetical protein
MTIRELIHILNNFDQDKKIVVKGYEGGYNNLKHIKETTVAPVIEKKWWYGEYDDIEMNKYGLLVDDSKKEETILIY